MRRYPVQTMAILLLSGLWLGADGCRQGVIQVGLVVPLSGEHSIYGEANRRGVELAFDEITSNGYPLELALAVDDSASDPAKATELLEKQFDGGVFAALGGTVSEEAQAMIAVAEKYDRVLLSPSATAPVLTGASPNFYRIAPSGLTEGNKMADFAVRHLGISKVVVIAESKTYARGVQEAFTAAFEHHGGEVVELIELPTDTSDLGGLIGRVMTVKPDAVYLAAYEAGVSAMILELEQLGFEGKVLTTHAFATPSAIARVGDAAQGVILTQSVFEPDSDFAHVQHFVTAYRERYGEEPDLFAAEGYDAMNVLAAALEARHTIASEVTRGLRDEVKDFPGVTGSIQFDERGDVTKFPRVYVIGDDLGLYDMAKQLEAAKRGKIERQKELRAKLDAIRRSAANVGNGS